MVVFVELLKNLFVGEEEFLLDLLINCVFLGVDEVVYVKVGFLVVIVKGEVKFFLLILEKVIELLGIMQGGYNIYLLIDVLDDVKLVFIVVKVFFYMLLMFDNFYDVEEKVKVGNEYVKQVMQFWVDVEWFLNCLVLVEKLIVIVFKVIGEINMMEDVGVLLIEVDVFNLNMGDVIDVYLYKGEVCNYEIGELLVIFELKIDVLIDEVCVGGCILLIIGCGLIIKVCEVFGLLYSDVFCQVKDVVESDCGFLLV